MRYDVFPGPLVSKNFVIMQSSDMWVRAVLSLHRQPSEMRYAPSGRLPLQDCALEAPNTFVENHRLLDAPYGNTNVLNLVNFHSGGMYYVGLEIFKTYARRDIYYTISEVDGILETIVLAVLEHR